MPDLKGKGGGRSANTDRVRNDEARGDRRHDVGVHGPAAAGRMGWTIRTMAFSMVVGGTCCELWAIALGCQHNSLALEVG